MAAAGCALLLAGPWRAAAQPSGEPPMGRYAAPAAERTALGRRCNAYLPTDLGPRRSVCRLDRAYPRGEPCRCPAPPGLVGFSALEGHVVR